MQRTIEYQTNEQSTKYELKYGNTKLLRNTKYNQVELVLAIFVSAILYQVSIKLYLSKPDTSSKTTLESFDFNKYLTIR